MNTFDIVKKDPSRVIIFDTTLRDGEQSPGASMNLDEKLRIATVLADMGVDVIEAGFPIASDGDFEAVHEIAKSVKGATICGLARATKMDIDRAAEALKPAERNRIHTFISTSPLHMKYKLQMEPEKVLEKVTESVTYARTFTDDVEWSAEDGSRTEHDFLCRCVEAAIKAGATTINIPDTVGYAMPDEFGELIRLLFNRVPNIDQAIISVHCHNDLGLAVSNSLAAVRAGARQVECTINGLGERAGNAAMEEIVMGLRTRPDHLPFSTGVKTENITKASKLVSTITGFVVQPNKAIVGKNAFAHESGVHQDGFLKKKDTYEIMNPQDIGLESSELVLGKHSGRNALGKKIEAMGYRLTQEELDRVFTEFKILADEKKELFDEDIVALIQKQKFSDEELNTYSLQKVQGTYESGTLPSATVTLKSRDGNIHTETGQGDGPIDAIYNAVDHITGMTCKLLDYQVMAKTRGKDAQGEVTVRVLHEDREVLGKGTGVNTVEASAEAYVNAINKLLIKTKSGPVEGGEIQGP